jgi:hypothetical protein
MNAVQKVIGGTTIKVNRAGSIVESGSKFFVYDTTGRMVDRAITREAAESALCKQWERVVYWAEQQVVAKWG